MAKKSANPADAFRKAQRAKELKKNKEERKKVRETQTIKKDTRELESEIRDLKREGKLNAADKARLADLESELSRINKVKESYVAEHPEARDRVFRTNDRSHHREGGPSKQDAQQHLYDESGKLRDPTRSIYFDPVYNPFGVPPPGMPYRERSPVGGTIGEKDEDDEEDEDSDDDDDDDEIVLPEGPPPGGDGSDSDDSDDIPLPEGPPPPRALPQRAPPLPSAPPPLPLPFAGPPMSMGFPSHGQTQHPPFQPPFPVPPPSEFRSRPPRPQHVPPDRPAMTVQDPLSDAPTQTYQGYRASKHELPARPGVPGTAPTGPAAGAGPSSTGTISSEPQLNGNNLPSKPKPDPEAGTISAAPVMRDLRKEATTFVPRGVKRKKAAAPGGVTVNAAPGSGRVDEDGDQLRERAKEDGGGLMGKLKGVFGSEQEPVSAGPVRPSSGGPGGGGDEDYQKFLEGLDDL